MRVAVIASATSPHQTQHQKAMAEGLHAIGLEPVLVSHVSAAQTEHVACWGWRSGELLRQMGKEVLVMERGYIGDRFRYTSLGWNGLNGHATFPEYADDNGVRFSQHGGMLLPWKNEGDYALILGQVPGDKSLRGRSLMPWYEQTAADIKERMGFSVHFRQHPEAAKRGYIEMPLHADISKGTLAEALAGAHMAVCFNSNSSVDAVLSGVPCVVGDKGSMAYEVCTTDLYNPVRPERAAWAHQLAFKQWELNEIASGIPLRKLFEGKA